MVALVADHSKFWAGASPHVRTADVVFASAALVAIGFEAYAILNKVDGDTLSERTRVYFEVKGPVGSMIFLATLGTGAAWFAAHIVERKV